MSRFKLNKLPKLSSKRTKKVYNFPEEYVSQKFYELGYKVTYNKYNNTYNSCCPICREGKSWGRKTRCYYIPEHNNIYCHNCGESLSPYNWILKVSGMSEDELQDDFLSSKIVIDLDKNTNTTQVEVPSLPTDCINLMDHNQLQFYSDNTIVQQVVEYVKNRRLYESVNKPDALYLSLKDKYHRNRLIIPFKDSKCKIIHYQSRKVFLWDLDGNYLSKFNSEKSIYGIERVVPELDTVFLFEGPLDACFVQNGLGLAGISEGQQLLTDTQEEQMMELSLYRKIWVLDNQWIDGAARKKTEVLVERGETVFFWPKELKKYKDFNEICVGCGINGVSTDFVKRHSYSGKAASLKVKVLFKEI